jgi:hypothetical protein
MNTRRVLRIPMIELVIITLILLAVGGLAMLFSVAWPLIHIPSGQSPIQADSLKMVDAFHTTGNSHNMDAVLALFTEDATITDSGFTVRGRDQIRKWILYSQRMAGLHLTLIHSQVAGEKVFWHDLAHGGPEIESISYVLRWMAVI